MPRHRPTDVDRSGWRARASRQLIDDARALVSMAEGLRAPDLGADEGASQRAPFRESPRAVLVHAMSIDEADALPSGGQEAATRGALPILVLLDDAPEVPDFLPEGADIDLDHPTEEQVRAAIEQRFRNVFNRPPSERSILDVVESIRDAVLVIDRAHSVVYLNLSAASLLQSLTGRTGPFVGEPLARVFPPAASPTIRPAIHDALTHANASRVEDPERHRGFSLEVAVFPNPDGATLVVRDVTERRLVEAELVEARLGLARAEARLRALGDEAPA